MTNENENLNLNLEIWQKVIFLDSILFDLKTRNMIIIILLQVELKFVKIFHILTRAFKFTVLTICRKQNVREGSVYHLLVVLLSCFGSYLVC
jgi:hypothetical protein